jgi:hypothetical protein
MVSRDCGKEEKELVFNGDRVSFGRDENFPEAIEQLKCTYITELYT